MVGGRKDMREISSSYADRFGCGITNKRENVDGRMCL
jgi:hypothetical protein